MYDEIVNNDKLEFVVINDDRKPKEFSNITFSNYSKKKVENELLKTLKCECIEESCYWSAELLCSGHFSSIWEIFLHFFCKNIHISNPKICIYLENKLKKIIELSNSQKNIFIDTSNSTIDLRNIEIVRKEIMKICIVLCYSSKRICAEPIKINKIYDFQLENICKKIKSTNNHIEEIFDNNNDPKELFIPCNELYNELLQKNITGSCYWLEWLIEFDLFCKNKKNPLICSYRSKYDVGEKYFQNVSWLIWDIFLHFMEKQLLINFPKINNENNNRNNDAKINDIYFLTNYKEKKKEETFLEKVFNSCLFLFCNQFCTKSLKSRKYVFYFIIELLIGTYNINDFPPILDEKKHKLMFNHLDKCNVIYKQIKKAEISNKKYSIFNINI